MKWFGILLSGLMIAVGSEAINPTISCKDENGDHVDWFYAYKMPKQYPGETKGFEFVSLKPGERKWSRSSLNINSVDSSIGRTMAQAFTKLSHPNRAVVAYNDHPPFKGTDSNNGHSKGVVIADDQTGVWIVHSVPQFPSITENPSDYFYPATGSVYGQSFLCISVNASEVDKIGMQLVYNEAVVYTFRISENLESKYPSLKLAANRLKIILPPFQRLAEIQSRNGVVFQSFAKTRNFAQDLYANWVAATLRTDLYVQVWRKGTGMMPSDCTMHKSVWNVAEISMVAIDFTFKTTTDHSKWAVSANSERVPWLCMGDINRANRQQTRGGGTVCQKSDAVGNAYLEIINAIDLCK